MSYDSRITFDEAETVLVDLGFIKTTGRTSYEIRLIHELKTILKPPCLNPEEESNSCILLANLKEVLYAILKLEDKKNIIEFEISTDQTTFVVNGIYKLRLFDFDCK
jgi:hypothetical protein